MRDCAAEKEKGGGKKNVNEMEPGKNRPSSSRGASRGRWEEDKARTRGAPAALPRLGGLPRSYDFPARGQTGPTKPVTTSHTNGGYIGDYRFARC